MVFFYLQAIAVWLESIKGKGGRIGGDAPTGTHYQRLNNRYWRKNTNKEDSLAEKEKKKERKIQS